MTQLTDNWMLILDKDIDDVLADAIPYLPTERLPFLRDTIAILNENELSSVQVAKVLSILQVLLSNQVTELGQDELIGSFERLVRLANDAGPSTVSQQAIAVAQSLASRIRNCDESIPASAIEQLKLLASDSTNESIRVMATALMATVVRKTPSQVSAAKKVLSESVSGDISKSIETVTADLGRDWYRDPWMWPELQWLSKNQDLVVARLAGRDCSWTQPLDVPKKTGSSRPAMVMSPIDRVAYQVLADELSLAAAADLPEWVYGWRLNREGTRKATYANNALEWRKFNAHRAENLSNYSHVLRVDVQSFFASVDTELLLSQLGRRYKKTGALLRLEGYFEEWVQRPNGRGLPQRSIASSILAHVPLRPVDVFLEQYQRRAASPFTALRWMDDIYLFSDAVETLLSASAEIEAILDRQRLQLNASKTLLIDSEDSDSEDLLDLSGDEDDDDEEVGSSARALAAITELLEGGEEAPDSRLRYLSKVVSGASHESLGALRASFPGSDVLESWGFAADSLARLLRSTGLWREKADWYVSHIDSHIAPQTWTVAAWGDMFPEDGGQKEVGIESVANAYERLFETAIQSMLVPIASHLLGAWYPKKTSDVLQGFLSAKTHQPSFFELRGVTLALKRLGEDKRGLVRLAERSEDEVFIRYLKES